LSCSEEGYPKFFVETSDHSAMMHNLNAEMLTVEYDMPCNIIEGNQVVDNLPNVQYPMPNYLTGRLVNVKLAVEW
ncbi:MAG: hypothetical protein J6S48_04575, partial [Bacteroidales bacterium]|nr:hypothetical protein [Bacteroidales bacterium]